jgi:hypothetical protein
MGQGEMEREEEAGEEVELISGGPEGRWLCDRCRNQKKPTGIREKLPFRAQELQAKDAVKYFPSH